MEMKMKDELYKRLKDRLYRLYWPYTCQHCGHEGLVQGRDGQCKNYECRKEVVPDRFESLEDQEARWAEEDKLLGLELITLFSPCKICGGWTSEDSVCEHREKIVY